MPILLSAQPLSKNYIDRLALQEEIGKKLSHAVATKPIVLAALKGLSGVGKTQLAAHYYAHAERYEFKQWFNAESADTLKTQYLAYAIEKGLFTTGMSIEVTAGLVVRHFESHPGWLLVLDNADNYDEIKDLLPKTGGNIIITSRTRYWPDECMIDVDVLTNDEARSLVRKITNSTESDEEIDKLTNMLGKLPLAIAQASAYIKKKKKRITTAEYLRRYTIQENKFLADKTLPVGDKHDPVAITWQINFKAVKKVCPHAGIIQLACAYLDAVNIPNEILKIVLTNQPGMTDIDAEYDEAKSALLEYSLIEEDPEKQAVNIHQLVQAVTRHSMTEDKTMVLIKRLTNIFMGTLAKDAYEVIAKQIALFTHFDKLLSYYKTLPLSELIFAAALSKGAAINCRMRSMQSLMTAIDYYEAALAMMKKLLGEKHPSVATSLNNLGNAYYALGGEANTRKAIGYYEAALTMRKKLLGEEHSSVASSLNNLGAAYSDLGGEANTRKAIDYNEAALAMMKKLLGEEHPSVATSLNNLGEAYRALGGETNTRKAIDYYEAALEMMKKLLREEHPDLAGSLNNLGNAYYALGGKVNIRKAINYHEDAWAMRKKLFGEEHPDVASSLNNLGLAYSDLGGEANTRKAIGYHEAALAMRRKLFGEEHPDVASSLNNLGNAYRDLGGEANIHKAIGYLEAALAMKKRLLREEHPSVASSLNNLGTAYDGLRGEANTRKAIDYYKAALTMRKKLLGEEHPDVASTLFNMSLAYIAINDLAQAEPLLLQAQILYKKQLIADHPYVLQVENEINQLQLRKMRASSNTVTSVAEVSAGAGAGIIARVALPLSTAASMDSASTVTTTAQTTSSSTSIATTFYGASIVPGSGASEEKDIG